MRRDEGLEYDVKHMERVRGHILDIEKRDGVNKGRLVVTEHRHPSPLALCSAQH